MALRAIFGRNQGDRTLLSQRRWVLAARASTPNYLSLASALLCILCAPSRHWHWRAYDATIQRQVIQVKSLALGFPKATPVVALAHYKARTTCRLSRPLQKKSTPSRRTPVTEGSAKKCPCEIRKTVSLPGPRRLN